MRGRSGRPRANEARWFKHLLDPRDVHTIDGPETRAVGFKLSDGMEIPSQLATRFKAGRARWSLVEFEQNSPLAGVLTW